MEIEGTVCSLNKISMRILHLDCFSGISGDMAVGALRDLGIDEHIFHDAVSALGLGDEIHLHFKRDARQGISGWKFNVHAHDHGDHVHDHHRHDYSHGSHGHDHGHGVHIHGRTWRQIRKLLEKSTLHPEVKSRAISVFQCIAVAEAKIHGVPVEEIGFHEVGAADSIADIVAACAGFHALGPLRVEASVLVEGSGWVECAHGKFPLPAPATLEILKGIPLRQVDEAVEFITPTGAALLAEYATRFGTMGEMGVERIGYGLGTRDTSPRPNVLRAVIGNPVGEDTTDEISQIETNLDDITPEQAGAAMELLLGAGALDVFFTPAQMKKNRPGFLLTVLCDPEKVDALAALIFRTTTSFGVRIHKASRIKLRREVHGVETPFGAVDVKFGYHGKDCLQRSPEFESCRRLAEKTGIALRDIYLAAESAAAARGE
jgi:uncharacterized protein (TIGR00299 family) protein